MKQPSKFSEFPSDLKTIIIYEIIVGLLSFYGFTRVEKYYNIVYLLLAVFLVVLGIGLITLDDKFRRANIWVMSTALIVSIIAIVANIILSGPLRYYFYFGAMIILAIITIRNLNKDEIMQLFFKPTDKHGASEKKAF
jgi:hypothetical protein